RRGAAQTAPPTPVRRSRAARGGRRGPTAPPVSSPRAVQPSEFLRASRVVIVAGKGGVGKTTVTAALARLAAAEGLDALIVEVEGKSGLSALFDRPQLSYEESIL